MVDRSDDDDEAPDVLAPRRGMVSFKCGGLILAAPSVRPMRLVHPRKARSESPRWAVGAGFARTKANQASCGRACR